MSPQPFPIPISISRASPPFPRPLILSLISNPISSIDGIFHPQIIKVLIFLIWTIPRLPRPHKITILPRTRLTLNMACLRLLIPTIIVFRIPLENSFVPSSIAHFISGADSFSDSCTVTTYRKDLFLAPCVSLQFPPTLLIFQFPVLLCFLNLRININILSLQYCTNPGQRALSFDLSLLGRLSLLGTLRISGLNWSPLLS